MKIYLALASAALVSTPAFAAETSTSFDGQVGVELGYQDNGNNIDEPASSGATYQVGGSVALPVTQTLGLQVDVSHSQDLMNLPYGAKVNSKATAVTGHLFVRKTDKFLLGAIGQVNFNAISTQGYGLDTNQYFIGGEGQLYLSKVTLTGQVAYRKDDFGDYFFGPDSFNQSGVIATAQAKLFIKSNWSLAAKGEYSNVDFGDAYPVSVDSWRLDLVTERRLSKLPVSYAIKASYGEIDVDGLKLNDFRITFGLKFNFGSQTLQERDRSGASLEAIKTDALLPFFS